MEELKKKNAEDRIFVTGPSYRQKKSQKCIKWPTKIHQRGNRFWIKFGNSWGIFRLL